MANAFCRKGGLNIPELRHQIAMANNELVVVVPGFSHRPDNGMDFDRLLKDILAPI
jgi:hypothetical protein